MDEVPGLHDFPRLYQELRAPLLRYVQHAVRDGEIAEELTQEVFLKAYRARASYRPESAPSTWIWAIARNTVLDWHRRRQLEPWPAQESEAGSPDGRAFGDGEDAPLCERLPSPEPDAETRSADHASRLALRRRLRELTRPQRRVLLARAIRGLGFQEIGARLGLSPSAVKCLYYRARLRLAEPADASVRAPVIPVGLTQANQHARASVARDRERVAAAIESA